MATSDFQLSAPPDDPDQRELWLQHAAGMIFFQDVRQYALEQLPPDLTAEAAAAARKAIADGLSRSNHAWIDVHITAGTRKTIRTNRWTLAADHPLPEIIAD